MNSETFSNDCDIHSLNLENDDLNRNLGGGFPKNSLILIEGEVGSGKSLISQRFCYSFLKNNLKTTYVSSDFNLPSFVDQMSSLDYNIYPFLENKNLLFFPLFSNTKNIISSKNIFNLFLNSKEIFNSDVIFFDDLSSFYFEKEMTEEKAYQLMNKIKTWTASNKTVIFSIDPKNIDSHFLKLMRSISDIYLQLEKKEVAGNKLNIMNVHRFKRARNIVSSSIPFKVEPQKGLTIDITSLE